MPETDVRVNDDEKVQVKEQPKQIHGLLVNYQDDEISDCVHLALRGKKRVHYKCIDSVSNFLALGTSVGAIYLFRLANISQPTCKLALVLPCDQGPIEVIRFLPNQQANGLLVAIGTARGSIVIFQLEFNQNQSVSAQEIYRAEKFTKSESIGIKFIEHDQDLLDPCQPFTKLYICDQKCRIFVLDGNSIFSAFTLLYNNKPTPVLDVLDSEIHQIFVQRSSLLLSTDERTQVFKEYSTRPDPIGRTQRKRGFYGACFYNSNYKPARLQQQQQSSNRVAASQQTIYSSTASLADLENLVIFVARPKFSLWQVNYKRQVLFTHKFESSIKSSPPSRIVPLHNEPLTSHDVGDDTDANDKPELVTGCFEHSAQHSNEPLRSDHFERLLPIFSPTLGNLLLSYTRHELFVIDPMAARLVIWHSYDKPIHQVCCNENEIFILFEVGRRNFQVDRIVLLAPTQFVLELHRLNRHASLMAFVEMFSEQFRSLMALPLSGPGTITTEGGLLRNIVWSTWHEYCERKPSDGPATIRYENFKSLVDEIVNESALLKHSIDNPNDMQLLFIASNDNIERLCTEPYASMVSLDISIANLHTNHVVHFSQEALNRQKSLARLSQSILNLNRLKRTTSTRLSLLNLDEANENRAIENKLGTDLQQTGIRYNSQFYDKKVSVAPLRPRKGIQQAEQDETAPEIQLDQTAESNTEGVTIDERESVQEEAPNDDKHDDAPEVVVEEPDFTVCPECRWPRPRAHLKPMRPKQQAQFKWIQEDLMPYFENYIDQIESCAFEQGLWHLVLRCLAFRNKLEEYINCCIMLDDVRLLNMEKFVAIKCGEEEFINLVFKQLEHKLEFHDEIRSSRVIVSSESDDKQTYRHDLTSVCSRCKHVSKTRDENCIGDKSDDGNSSRQHGLDDDDGQDDDISFNLVNLLKKIMLRRSSGVKRVVGTLLQYPKLLERSKIPASFYLQTLGNQCSLLRRDRHKV